MRRTMTLLVTLAMLATMLASPSAVAKPPSGSGGQIYVLTGEPTTYPAGNPFHIIHGNGFDRTNPEASWPPGRSEFLLMVDGAFQPLGQRVTIVGGELDVVMAWLYNFPEGLPADPTDNSAYQLDATSHRVK